MSTTKTRLMQDSGHCNKMGAKGQMSKTVGQVNTLLFSGISHFKCRNLHDHYFISHISSAETLYNM